MGEVVAASEPSAKKLWPYGRRTRRRQRSIPEGENRLRLGPAAILLGLLLSGCGINKSRLATEQLVVSDAVDRAVASIDFSSLSGKKIFFDTQFLDGVNMGSNANIKYVISSLRQQMMAYDCRLQEKADSADYIVEGRVGVLANDGHEVTYGIPGGAAAASASVLLSSPITIPTLPELSLGRRNHHAGTAKLGLFAYDRVTREPVWQAGVKKASSESRDSWILGLGPYQAKPRTARKGMWRTGDYRPRPAELARDPVAAYSGPIVFERAVRPAVSPPAAKSHAMVNHQTPVGEKAAQPVAPQAPQVSPAIPIYSN